MAQQKVSAPRIAQISAAFFTMMALLGTSLATAADAAIVVAVDRIVGEAKAPFGVDAIDSSDAKDVGITGVNDANITYKRRLEVSPASPSARTWEATTCNTSALDRQDDLLTRSPSHRALVAKATRAPVSASPSQVCSTQTSAQGPNWNNAMFTMIATMRLVAATISNIPATRANLFQVDTFPLKVVALADRP